MESSKDEIVSLVTSVLSFAITTLLFWFGIQGMYPSLHTSLVVIIAGCLASSCMFSWSMTAVAIGFGVI
jgi:type III secretory pathway component EscU